MKPEPEYAPKAGCGCEVCIWLRRERPEDIDLAENYQRYLDGELVSRDDRD